MGDLLSENQYYRLWGLVIQTRDAISMVRQKELSKYHLTTRRAAVLFAMKAIGNRATPSSIGRMLLRKRHSISTLLRRMEKDGLIKRARNIDRGNTVNVVFTKKGHQAYANMAKMESIQEVFSLLSESERVTLQLLLKSLRDAALKKSGPDYLITRRAEFHGLARG